MSTDSIRPTHARLRFPNYLLNAIVLFQCLLSQAASISDIRHTPEDLIISLSFEGAVPDDVRFEFTADLSDEQSWQPFESVNRMAVGSSELTFTLSHPGTPLGYFRFRYPDTPGISSLAPRLNEIASNNETSLADEDGDFSDWIELYNPHLESVSLAGWHLSDRADELDQWPFPPLTLDAGAYLLVYASGKDRRSPDAPLHTNFRLAADGEPVLLSNETGQLVDQIHLERLEDDETLGRLDADGTTEWYRFTSSSPGEINPTTEHPPFVPKPRFTTPPGTYTDSVAVTIAVPSHNVTITYTTDGSIPSATSTRFESPHVIETSQVLRLIATHANGHQSDLATGTFLIGTNHQLPVVSIAAEPDNFNIRDGFLYGFGSHMYQSGEVTANYPYSQSNAWKDREIGASIELFEPEEESRFQQDIGLKVFGGWGSRGYPQKSFAIFARQKYGSGKIRHRVFPDLDIDEFESFVLRNSGNDNQSTHQIPPRPPITEFGDTRSNGSYFVNSNYTLFRDAMLQRVARNLDVDTQAYRPAVLYVNGDYWGIYNLREKFNEHFVESHHGVDSDQVDLIEGYGKANAGTAGFYQEALRFINRNMPRSDSNYETVQSTYFHIDSFIDYHLAVIYFQNFDIGNIKLWRAQDGGRFRWMLYDQDYGFNLWPKEVYEPAMARNYSDYRNMFTFYTNGTGTNTGWPNSGGRTLFLRRLLGNNGFRESFLTRCLDLLNTDFASPRVKEIIHSMAATIRPEIPRHLERWSWASLRTRRHGSPFKPDQPAYSPEGWEANVAKMVTFAENRPEQLRADIAEHFKIEPAMTTTTFVVSPLESGTIQVNSLDLSEFPWDGTYLNELNTHITAKPNEGYAFETWTGAVADNASPATSLAGSIEPRQTITAVFRRVP